MSIDYEKFTLKLGPNVRLRMTIAEEMRLDPNDEIFNAELQAKYVSMQREAERQLQAALKGAVYADIGLCLLLFGKNIKIPGLDFGLQDIPAAVEVLTVAASFCFLVCLQAFANNQCYLAVIDQFSNKRALKLGVDPDYLTYGDVFSQVFLKAFRPKMSNYGRDFFEPRGRYVAFYAVVTILLMLSWFSLLVMHFIVVGVGVWNSIGDFWFWWPFAGAMTLIHFTGLVMVMFLDFTFDTPPRFVVQEDRWKKAEEQRL